MNKDNKRRKMAIGAVVAAGVTTGAMAATPAQDVTSQETKPEVQLTAADQVVIDGQNIDFDEMLAQLPPQVRNDRVRLMYGVKTVYGPPPRDPRFDNPQIQKEPVADTAAVADSVISIIARQANFSVENVNPKMSLRRDLGLKRADIDKVVVEIERMFNVVIPSRKIRSFKRVDQIINYVKAVM